jgi:hypothetical protein
VALEDRPSVTLDLQEPPIYQEEAPQYEVDATVDAEGESDRPETSPSDDEPVPPQMVAEAIPATPIVDPEEAEWQRLVESLKRAVDGFRVEEWFAQPAKTNAVPKAVPDEWGFYNSDQCGIAALMDQLDAAAREQHGS